MNRITIKEAYENLCNAVVLRAFEDVVDGSVALYRYGREPPKDPHRIIYVSKLIQDGKRFLMSERLKDFTEVSGDFILKEAEKKIKYGKECVDLEFMYREYEKGIYYEEN